MKQREFDFPRAYQTGCIINCLIPSIYVPPHTGKGRGVNVSGHLSKSVLVWIDEYGRGIDDRAFVSEQRMAKELRVSQRSVVRAIAALESRSLLIVNRSGRSNRYTIVWDELSLLCSSTSRPPVAEVELRNRRQAVRQLTAKHATNDEPNGPTKGDMLTAIGDMVSTKGDMLTAIGDTVSPQSLLSSMNPPPREVIDEPIALGVEVLQSDWSKIEERLRGYRGNDGNLFTRWPVAVREAKHKRLAPVEFAAILDQYDRNRSRFQGPGAILDRVRNDCWCVALPDAKIAAEAKAKVLESQSAKARDRAEFAAARNRPMVPWSAEELAGLRKLGVEL